MNPTLALLIAQTSNGESQGNALVSLLPLILLGVFFYLMLIRPRKAQMKRQQELLASIGVGDEVETFAGIYGTVKRADDDVMWLEIAPGTTVKISRAAVRRKVYADDESTTEG